VVAGPILGVRVLYVELGARDCGVRQNVVGLLAQLSICDERIFSAFGTEQQKTQGKVTGKFADKPTRGHSGRGLVNSWANQLAERLMQ